jgi:toxin ParE1/3/4
VKPFAFHPEADAEFITALEHYAGITPDLGNRFYDEIHRLVADACTQPQVFRFIRPPARRHLARDFPFGLIYVDQPDRIWILAVMPLRRKPGYWQHRLA